VYLCNKTPYEAQREQKDRAIMPEYSYWAITFTGEDASVNLILNAVTGQIWRITIMPKSREVNLTSASAESALKAYLLYLEIENDDIQVIVIEGGYMMAYVNIDDGSLFAGFLGNGKSADKKELVASEFTLFLSPRTPLSPATSVGIDETAD
jgi:hypothetical protein